MIGYAERHCLSSCAVEAYRRACTLVDRVENHATIDGHEIRCHELARAVARWLTTDGFVVEVVDGQLGPIDHTWILVPGRSGAEDAALLDVYTPGRIPQVQLLHDHPFVSRGYEQNLHRTDIRQDVVEDLHRRMGRESRQNTPGPDSAWVRWFATALAGVHDRLVNGNERTEICRVAREAGVDLSTLRTADVMPNDVASLQRAGLSAGEPGPR